MNFHTDLSISEKGRWISHRTSIFASRPKLSSTLFQQTKDEEQPSPSSKVMLQIMRSYLTVSVHPIMQPTQTLHPQSTALLHLPAPLLAQLPSSKQVYRNSQRSPSSRYGYDEGTQVALHKNTTARGDDIDAVDNCADQQ